MALTSVSKSPLSGLSSLSTPSAARGLSRPQGAQRPNALQKLLASDGFDSPVSMKGAGGIEATVRVLTQVVQQLAEAAKMLTGETGAPGVGATSPMGSGGVPDLGASGGVPDLGAAAPQAPSAAAPQAPSAKAAESQAVSPSTGGSKAERTMTFTNDGKSPMTIQFTPNAGEKAIEPITLKPGEKRTVEFPEGWSGNFRSAAGDGKAATLGEVKFNGGGNQTYYDVSYIEGDNAAMTIQPDSGGRKSGTLDNLLASAPDSIKAKDASGHAYGIKKTTTSNVQDPSVVNYYRQHVGADQGYVIPTDDASTLGSSDSHLDVHLKSLE